MKSKSPFLAAGLTILFLPIIASAQKYLVGIPGIDAASLNFNDYINALYALAISVAALLAVIKIIIAGMKYMLSGVVTSKQEAISDIQGAVFGLLIVVLAYAILYFINPKLTTTTVFIDQAEPVVVPPAVINVGGGEVTNGIGYFYAPAGTVPDFDDLCKEEGPDEIYRLQSGNDVCYKPIPPAIKTKIDNLYQAVNGESNYASMDEVYKRWQTSHIPRLITDEGDLNSVKDDLGVEQVLVLVIVTPERDWIDQAQQDAIQKTCEDLQKITNTTTGVRSGNFPSQSISDTDVPGDTGKYIACVKD